MWNSEKSPFYTQDVLALWQRKKRAHFLPAFLSKPAESCSTKEGIISLLK